MPLNRSNDFDPGLPPAEYALPEAPGAEFMDIPKAFGAGVGEGTATLGKGLESTAEPIRRMAEKSAGTPAAPYAGMATAGGALGNVFDELGTELGNFFKGHMSEGGQKVMDTPLYQEGHFTDTAKNPLNWPIVAANAVGQTAPVLAASAAGGVPLATMAGFAQNAGGISDSVHNAIMQSDDNQLMQSPTFVNLFKNIDQDPQYSGYSDLQKIDLAKKQLGDTVAMADLGDPKMLAANLVASYTGDAYLGELFAGRMLSSSFAKTAGKAILRDGGINAGFAGISQLTENEGMALAGSHGDVDQGVKDQMITGGLTGIAMGAAPAIVGHVREGMAARREGQNAGEAEAPATPAEEKAEKAVDDIETGAQEVQQGMQDLKEDLPPEPPEDMFSKGLGEEGNTSTEPPAGYRAGLTPEQTAEQERLAAGFNDRQKFGGNGPDDFADIPAYMRAGKTVHADPDSRPFHLVDTAGPEGQVKARFDDKNDAEFFRYAQLLDQYTRGNHPDPDEAEHQAVKDWFYRMTRGVKREDAETPKKRSKRGKKSPDVAETPKREPRNDFEAKNIFDTIMGYYQYVQDAAKDAQNGEFTAPSMGEYADHRFPDRPLQIEDKNIIFAGGPNRYPGEPLGDERQAGGGPEFRAGERIRPDFIPADRSGGPVRAINTIEGEARRITPAIEDKNIIFSGAPGTDEGQRGAPPQFEGGRTKARRRLDRFEERMGSKQKYPELPELSSGKITPPDSVNDAARSGNGELYMRRNGKPFPSEGLARLSKPYEEAKKAGKKPKVVQVDGGYAVDVPEKKEKSVKKDEAAREPDKQQDSPISLRDRKGNLTDSEINDATDEQLKEALHAIGRDYYRGLSNVEKNIVKKFENGSYHPDDARKVLRAHRDYWIRREAEGNEADRARDARLEKLYGHLSIPELENKLSEMGGRISGLQRTGGREFNGNGQRRTSPAQSNEAARGFGTEKLQLESYLEQRRKESPFLISSHDEHRDFFKRLIENPDAVTPNDVRAALDSTLANKQPILQGLNKLTKKQLEPFSGRYVPSDVKKDRLVANAWDSLVNDFRWLTNKGPTMVTTGNSSIEDLARDAMKGITQSDINEYADSVKQARAERQQRAEAFRSAIEDPKTLDDYRTLIKAKGRASLTPQQAEIYDQLLAEQQLAQQKDSKAKPRVSAGFIHDGEDLQINPIEEGRNSKTGETIYNVNLETRLGSERFKEAASMARQLGGGYWRGNFWFPTKEKAEQFTNWLRGDSVDHSASDAERQQRKQEQQSERLTGSSERLRDNAEERLNADRKVNTVKRLREAASAMDQANRDLRDAEIMQKIASGIGDGSLKYLTGIQHKTQIDTLRGIARRLIYDIPQDIRDKLSYTTSDGKREWNDDVPLASRVKYARYPMLDWHPSTLFDVLAKMGDARGYKLAAADLRLSQQLEHGMSRLPAGRKANDKLAAYLSSQPGSWPEYVADFNRLQRAGITTRPMLRAALIELEKLSGDVPLPDIPKVQKMEMDLRKKLAWDRNAFNDFFPTPESRADWIASEADIQPGMDVLEPSAGNGVLAEAARKAGGNVDVVELEQQLRDILKEKGFNVVGSDFDTFTPDKLYDRVLMNPPFSHDLDIKHVQKAFEHLKPGGKLTAIVSTMAGERSNKRNKAFREWLNELGAHEEQLPEGMFKESMNPTSVATKLITLTKPDDISVHSDLDKLRAAFGPDAKYSDRLSGSEIRRKIANQMGTHDAYMFNMLLDSRYANDRERAIDLAQRLADEGGINFSKVPRSAWDDDFPDTVLHGRLGDATAHKDYEEAKGGDDAAARRLVADVMNRQSVDELRQLLNGRKAILAAVHAEEAVSRNAIPQAMADVLGKVLDLEVATGIVQSEKVGRTAQDGFGRLTNQPSFEGPVRTDLPYILLDDTLTQGGTLANLKGYIEDHGGKVIGASALTGKRYSARIALAAETLEKLRDHFEGTDLENWWNEQHGYGFDRLTESEANYLLRAADADKIRDRVLAARSDRTPPAEPGSIRDHGSLPPDVTGNFSTNASDFGGVSLSGLEAADLSRMLREKYDGLKLGLSGKGPVVSLDKIILPELDRNSGTGTQIMRQIMRWADQNGKTLALTPSADFGGNKNRLAEFYKRFGFKDNKGRDRDYEISESMYRPPEKGSFSANASEPGGVFASGSPRERIRSGIADYQPRGLSKKQVEDEAARFLKKWNGAGGIAVQVAKDMAEAEQLAGFPLPDALIHAMHLPNSGRIILIAKNLDSLSHVRAKLRHEILGHHALSEVVGPAEYDKLLRAVAAGQNSKSLKPYFDRVIENYEGADPWKQVEEVISHVIEDGERGFLGRAWDRVSGAVLQALRKSGFLSDENITAGEIRGMMTPIAKRLKNLGDWAEKTDKARDLTVNFSLTGKDGLFSKPLPGETETEATQRRSKNFGRVIHDTVGNVHNLRPTDIIKRLTSNLSSNALMIGTLTNRQLAAVYNKLMKTDYAGQYQDLQAKMEARRNRIMNSAERGIENQWNKLGKDESRSLSDLMVDATMTRVHPDKPLAEQERFQNLKNEQTRLRSSKSGENKDEATSRLVQVSADLDAMRENYNDLHSRWVKLSPEAKELWHDTEKWYKNSYADLKEALIQRINDVGGDQNAALISRVREQFERALKDGPYFPLARFGKYVVTARKDGDYIREHFETRSAALAALEAYRKDGYEAVQSVKAKDNGKNNDSAHSLGKEILELLNKSEDGSLNKEQLTDQVWQTMLELMPDASYARHFIRRRRVKGASHDARRAFANSAFHFAHHVSKIEYGHKMQAVLDDMGNEIDAAMKGDYSGVQPDNLETAQRMLDELKMRHEMTMNPSGDGFGNALTGTGYVFNMAANPSSAIINMTQTALVALPQLAARYGWKNAMKAMGAATVDYFRSADKRFKWFGKGSSWLDRDAWLSMSRSNRLNTDELELMKRLNEDGVISITQASSLAQRAESGTQDKIHFNKALDMSILVGGQLFHNIEVANREVTALAAYRLAKDAAGGRIDPVQAYKVASNAVYDAHFDYSSSNRPRWMRQSWQKVLFQFKMYAQHMFYTLGRSFTQSFKGETPEIRRQAQKEFLGYMLMHTLAAGVTGLPYAVQAIFGAAAQGIHAAVSDDDSPWDPEVALKNWLTDELGGFASTAITDGVVNALGIDLHSRVGIQDLLWRSPPEGTEGKDLYVYYMEQMLGPTIGGIGLNFANGYDKMAKGDWLGGIQTVTPAAVKNLVKTYSEATNGVTTSSGEEVVPADEFTGFELAAQAFGFSPSRIGQAYDARTAIKNVQSDLSGRRTQLLQRYFANAMAGDDNSDVLEDIQAYNRSNPTNAITGEVIVKAIRQKQKARLKKERGLALSRKDEHLRALGRFGNYDPIL